MKISAYQNTLTKVRILSWLIVFLVLGSTAFSQTIMFDDFTYSSVNDAQLAAFNKWNIIDGTSGPPEGGLYSKNNITFITDPANSGNKLMTLSTTVNGTSKATTHSRIETSGYEYFEGTYAARVFLSDVPFTYKDANIQTFYTIVSSALAGDGTKYSELDIVEYMAADKWGTSPDNRVAYYTSWNKYRPDPWAAWKTYFGVTGSIAGWHTVIAQCTDGVNVKYWIDDTYLGSQSVCDGNNPDNDTTSPVYPRSNMQVAFANWIWNNVVGSSTTSRTTTMQADWVLYYKNTALTKAQVDALVSSYRSQGLQRRNLAGQTVITNPCTVPAQPGPISGNTTVASGSSQTYSIASVTGATSYTWTLPSGWSGSSTTTSINTTAGSTGGTISVRANNSCGSSIERTLAVTIASSGANLALNKPTTTSSVEAPGLEGGKAVDGSGATRWASAYSDAQWIFVDLGATYNVNRVKITWEAAYGRNYKIQVAPSATGPWTDMKTITSNTALVNDHTGLTGSGRYVRMNGTLRGTAWGYSIFEMEVYGTSGCTTPAQPGVISGNTTVPSGSSQTYSIVAVSGATSYTWSLPSGWSGSSTSTSISTTAGSSGTISVVANNACGASTPRTLGVTVSGGGTPIRIEAENYQYMAGITTQACSEGGLNVTSFDPGDWMSFPITIPTAGTYIASFRVSATTTGKSILFEKDAGATLLATVPVSNTGGAQVWTTVSQNVTLPAGTYSVGLATNTGGVNINWFELTSATGGRLSKHFHATAEQTDIATISVYPNPVENTLFVKTSADFNDGRVNITDPSGKEYSFQQIDEGAYDVSALPSGLYVVRVVKNKRQMVKKFIKK